MTDLNYFKNSWDQYLVKMYRVGICGILISYSLYFVSCFGEETSDECSQYTSCGDCTLRYQCGWQADSGICVDDSDGTGETLVHEAPGCQGMVLN